MLAKYIIESSDEVINTHAELSNFISIPNLRKLTKDFAINNSDGTNAIIAKIKKEELALENGLDHSCDLCPTGDFGLRELLLMATLNRCLSNGGTSESLKIYLEELKRRQGSSFTLRIKNH